MLGDGVFLRRQGAVSGGIAVLDNHHLKHIEQGGHALHTAGRSLAGETGDHRDRLRRRIRPAGEECLSLGNMLLIRNPDALPSARHNTGRLVCRKTISRLREKAKLYLLVKETRCSIVGGYPGVGDLYCDVIPAQAGIQFLAALDSCFRRSDRQPHLIHFLSAQTSTSPPSRAGFRGGG